MSRESEKAQLPNDPDRLKEMVMDLKEQIQRDAPFTRIGEKLSEKVKEANEDRYHTTVKIQKAQDWQNKTHKNAPNLSLSRHQWIKDIHVELSAEKTKSTYYETSERTIYEWIAKGKLIIST